jgi:hypothetical protein
MGSVNPPMKSYINFMKLLAISVQGGKHAVGGSSNIWALFALVF